MVAELDVEMGTAVAQEIGGAFIRTDVRHQGDVDAAVVLAVQRYGGLDVLVNNAGATRVIQFFDIKAEELARHARSQLTRCLLVSPGGSARYGGR